jgi:hypothetical protein
MEYAWFIAQGQNRPGGANLEAEFQIQGDLDELLGVVNPHVYRRKTNEPPSLPNLPADAAHPYHLVVV